MKAKFISVLAVLATAALSLAAFAVPAIASAAKAGVTPCQRAIFFGAHGLGEGAAGTAPGTAHWGSRVELVFRQFQWSLMAAHKPLPEDVSVNYPQVNIDPKATAWRQFFQANTARNVANSGSGQLVKQLQAEHKACPSQAFVISGYSQGAWVVDKALHNLYSTSKNQSLGAEARAILHQIKFVFLMGDPAFPPDAAPNGGYGIATGLDFGYSKADYNNNGLSQGAFMSECLTGDPICNTIHGISDISDTSLNVHKFGYEHKNVICDTGGGNLDNLSYPLARCGGSTMAATV